MMNDERGVRCAHAASGDALALGVLSSLGRWIERHPWWGAGTTLLVGAVTLGIGPVLIWVMRFNRMASSEAQQFWHLSEWIRLNRGSDSGLGDLADRCKMRKGWAGVAVAGAVVGVIALLGSTIHVGWLVVWMVAAAIAYLAHWRGLRAHEGDVRLWFSAFSEIAREEGVEVAPVAERKARGLAITLAGGFWPVGMVECAKEHKSYSRVSGGVRKSAREMFKKMVEGQGMGLKIEIPVTWKKRCGNLKCMEFLREGAEFCWRCGSKCAKGGPPLDPYALNLTLPRRERE